MQATHLGAVVVLALAGGSGCVYGPFYDDTINSTTSSVTFNVYATKPGAVMTAECANHYSPFSQFGSKVASTTPSTLAGESIYAAPLQKVIPASCWDHGFGKPVTWLRFFQKKDGDTLAVQVFNADGPSCVADHIADGEGWLTAGWACRRTEGQQIRLWADE